MISHIAARQEGVAGHLNCEDEMRTSSAMYAPAEEQPLMELRVGQTFRGHILLVEDDISLARLEVDVLTLHGYVVTLVENGELALNILREIIPDLVLLDLNLPGAINGWNVLKALRAYTGTSTIPVLLTSAEATAQKHLRTRGEARSTLDHLSKPYPIQALLKRVDRMLHMTP